MRSIPLALILIVAATIHGDGIPVSRDWKHVTVDSFTIDLNEEQTKQVERHRKLTLTDTQRAPLLAVYDKTPATLEVVSSRYGDCTCFLDIYGIWCRPGVVEIPKDSLASMKYNEEYAAQFPVELEEQDPEVESEPNPDRYAFEVLILDSAGVFYLDGAEIDEPAIRTLLESMVTRRSGNPNLVCSISLDTPPPIDEPTDIRIRQRVEELRILCETRYINFWAPGTDREPEQ